MPRWARVLHLRVWPGAGLIFVHYNARTSNCLTTVPPFAGPGVLRWIIFVPENLEFCLPQHSYALDAASHDEEIRNVGASRQPLEVRGQRVAVQSV